MRRSAFVLMCLIALTAALPPLEGAVTIELASEEAAAGPVPATDKDINLVLPKRFFRPRGEAGFSEPYIAELHYTTDGGKNWESIGLFKDLDKPFEFRAEKEGRYGFFVTLVDRKGRSDIIPEPGTAPQVTVTVDWSAPTLSITAPAGGEIIGATSVLDVKWTAEDAFFPEAPITVEYSVDAGQTWQPMAAAVDNSGLYQWKPPAGFDARMLLRVTACDEVGHTAVAVTPAPIVVDTTAPSAKLVGPTLSAAESVTLEYSADDGEGSGVAEVRLFVSGDKGLSWSPAGKAAPDGTLVFEAKSGKYSLAANAVDRAGNAQARPASGEKGDVELQIDTKNPLVRLRTLDLGGSIRGRARIPIQWEAAAPSPAASPVSIFISPDDGNTWDVIASDLANTGTFFWEVPAINSARCRLKVTIRDASGALGEAVSINPFTIDSARPTSAIGLVPSELPGEPADLATVLRPLPGAEADQAPAEKPQEPPVGRVPPGDVSMTPEPTPSPDAPWTAPKQEPYEQPPGPAAGLEDLLKAGFAADRAGRLSIAREYFQRAADLATGDPRPHVALGRVYAKTSGFNYTSKKQSFEAAVYHFEKAISLGGEDADVLNDLGVILLQTKRNADAEKVLLRATEIGSSPIHRCNLGIAFKRQGKTAEATEAFKEALSLAGDMKEAHFYLGGLYSNAGMWAEARVQWEKAADGYGAESTLGKIALSGLQKAREALGEISPADESKTLREKFDRVR